MCITVFIDLCRCTSISSFLCYHHNWKLTTEGTCFDFILQVSFFFSTFTTKAYYISPSIIPAKDHLKAIDALVGVSMTHACNGIMGHALGETKSYKWKRVEQGGQGVPRWRKAKQGYQHRHHPWAQQMHSQNYCQSLIPRAKFSIMSLLTYDSLLASPVPHTLSRRRWKPPGSMLDMMSAELPSINWIHPQRKPAHHLGDLLCCLIQTSKGQPPLGPDMLQGELHWKSLIRQGASMVITIMVPFPRYVTYFVYVFMR